MCLVSPISCRHITCLWRLLVMLMNEWQSLYHSQSIVVCQHFFGLWLLNTQICLLLSDSDVQTFQKGKKIKTQKVKHKVMYLVAKLEKAFLVAENESHQQKDLPQADFLSCTWRIYSVSKNLLNNSEFCWLKIRPIVCFCSDLMQVYTVSVPMHFTILFGVLILLFWFINKVDFSLH